MRGYRQAAREPLQNCDGSTACAGWRSEADAGVNWREFLSSSLPIRSILRDVGCGPMLGAARLLELTCRRMLVLAGCQAESLTDEVHADERYWDD